MRLLACLALAAAVSAGAQSADSLPAFRTDSAAQDPFRKVEAGQSPWSTPKPASPDTGFRADTVTAGVRRRDYTANFHLRGQRTVSERERQASRGADRSRPCRSKQNPAPGDIQDANRVLRDDADFSSALDGQTGRAPAFSVHRCDPEVGRLRT